VKFDGLYNIMLVGHMNNIQVGDKVQTINIGPIHMIGTVHKIVDPSVYLNSKGRKRMYTRWCEVCPNCKNESVLWIKYDTKTTMANINDVKSSFMRSKKSKLPFYQNLMKIPQLFDEFLYLELTKWRTSLDTCHPISDVRIVP